LLPPRGGKPRPEPRLEPAPASGAQPGERIRAVEFTPSAGIVVAVWHRTGPDGLSRGRTDTATIHNPRELDLIFAVLRREFFLPEP
jgi:hypothetical protein